MDVHFVPYSGINVLDVHVVPYSGINVQDVHEVPYSGINVLEVHLVNYSTYTGGSYGGYGGGGYSQPFSLKDTIITILGVVLVLILGFPCIVLLLGGMLQLGHVVFGVDDPGMFGSTNPVENFFVAMACLAVGGLLAWLIAKIIG